MTQSAPHIDQPHADGPVLIIGSGLAGWTVAKEFRKLDATTPLLMLTAEMGDFYAKPALSNALAQNKVPTQLVTTAADKMVSTLGVTLLQNTVVTRIDAKTQEVETSKGSFGYRQLVLATGAQPIQLPLLGNATNEVVCVNSLNDYEVFRAKLSPNARVLIMGAGLIGCEFANDLAATGYRVSVVDLTMGPLNSLLPADASMQLKNALAGAGVAWQLGTSVQSLSRDAAGALHALLANGERIDADVVLSAVGLKPDCEMAAASGIHCERGVVVDRQLQTNLDHVYALGDNTQYAAESNGGISRTLPYVMPIMNAAKALAQTLTGQATAVQFPVMPVAVKTPVLPLVIVPPAPATAGAWQAMNEGVWRFVDTAGKMRGFVLAGQQTAQRAALIKLIEVT
jgi:rubredoxin-NAD+ reductase